ncbi:Primosomal replication protein N [Grimontia indica]|uniref:Primosomal replication protein N n=1 Tax=Grimontia indica TaxID=1056512 RepID=R1IEE0_9GAMM|nr:Primosomal replication protein N [Grimontia indica]
MSGQGSQNKTQHLALGSNIKVGGFLAYQTGRNGVGKLVLHADEIIDI